MVAGEQAMLEASRAGLSEPRWKQSGRLEVAAGDGDGTGPHCASGKRAGGGRGLISVPGNDVIMVWQKASKGPQRWSLPLPRVHYPPCSSAIPELLFCLQSHAQLWKQRSPTPLQISLVGVRTPGVRIKLRMIWQYVSASSSSCNAALTESHIYQTTPSPPSHFLGSFYEPGQDAYQDPVSPPVHWDVPGYVSPYASPAPLVHGDVLQGHAPAFPPIDQGHASPASHHQPLPPQIPALAPPVYRTQDQVRVSFSFCFSK